MAETLKSLLLQGAAYQVQKLARESGVYLLAPPLFQEMPKISRLSRDIVVTEKLDGTQASINIDPYGEVRAASKSHWVTLGKSTDNQGWARWVEGNKEDLLKLGAGWHRGEFWGSGIKRGYGLKEKRWSLFNTHKWSDDSIRPACCSVVPVLYTGRFDTTIIQYVLESLSFNGSRAAPGFMNPEGVVIFHTASGHLYKKTVFKDEEHKGQQQ